MGFIKWDKDRFVQPWVDDGEKGHTSSFEGPASQLIAARDIFETRFFDEKTAQFSAAELAAERSDPEMARWIAYLGQLEQSPELWTDLEPKQSPGKQLPKEMLPGHAST